VYATLLEFVAIVLNGSVDLREQRSMIDDQAEIEQCVVCGCLPTWFRPASLAAATATTKAAAAAVAAASAITAKATSTTAAAATTTLAWPGFVDFQGATSNFLSVEHFNRCSRFCIGRHFDEGEAFRSSSVAILDHVCRLNRSGLSKQFLKILTGSLER